MRMESGLSAGAPCHASAPVMLVMGSPEGGVRVAGALKGLQAESVFPPAQKSFSMGNSAEAAHSGRKSAQTLVQEAAMPGAPPSRPSPERTAYPRWATRPLVGTSVEGTD